MKSSHPLLTRTLDDECERADQWHDDAINREHEKKEAQETMNDSTQQSTLPYLESERHFRLYENYVKTIVDNWPLVTVFTPAPPHASVETLSTRIRMAVKSLREHQWDTVISMAKFIQCCDEIIVSTKSEPGKVVCGPYALVRKRTPINSAIESETRDVQSVPKINLINPELDLIKAVIVLHHYRILAEPSRIQSESDITTLSAGYDVAVNVETTSPQTFIVL